jgi:hypothetical protein
VTLVEFLNEDARPFVSIDKWMADIDVRQAITASCRFSSIGDERIEHNGYAGDERA